MTIVRNIAPKKLAYVQNRTQGIYTGTYNATDGAGTDTAITPMTLTITPTSSSSIVELEWVMMGEPNGNGYTSFIVKKDGVIAANSTDGVNGWSVLTTAAYDGANGNSPTIVVAKYIETAPVAGVSASYDICVRSSAAGTASWYHNRVITSTGQINDEAGLSVATAIELF